MVPQLLPGNYALEIEAAIRRDVLLWGQDTKKWAP